MKSVSPNCLYAIAGTPLVEVTYDSDFNSRMFFVVHLKNYPVPGARTVTDYLVQLRRLLRFRAA